MLNNNQITSLVLSNVIVEGMKNLKAKDIVSIDLTNLDTAVCDFFVICHGTSDTHVSAISESIIDQTLKTFQEKPWHKEGLTNGSWVLLDYGNVVAHIFQKEHREYFNLETLWGDAKIQFFKESA
ncbi:MAG: ribosome silencing factor [Bacteroidota bacterium]|nr:ribosome silencing factor [Bacteroidota bacterium]